MLSQYQDTPRIGTPSDADSHILHPPPAHPNEALTTTRVNRGKMRKMENRRPEGRRLISNISRRRTRTDYGMRRMPLVSIDWMNEFASVVTLLPSRESFGYQSVGFCIWVLSTVSTCPSQKHALMRPL